MLHVFASLILVIIGFGIVKVLLKAQIASREDRTQDFPYQRNELFTAAERSFLGVLEQALAGQYRVMGKVRLGDVIKSKSGQDRSAWQRAQNQIQSKHVDFVVCDPATLSVQFVVELDDKSHNRSDRKDRDDFVDRALQAAGIRILHFPAKGGYSIQAIRDQIYGANRPSEMPAAPAPLQR